MKTNHPIKNKQKTEIDTSTKKIIWMANKHIKKC